ILIRLMRWNGWRLGRCYLWCLLTAYVNCGVDLGRVIMDPHTFEESLCAYVVAIFIGGWVIVLTFVISYWMWYRVPVPRYTYKLVAGVGDAERTIREAGVSSITCCNKNERHWQDTNCDNEPLSASDGSPKPRLDAEGDGESERIRRDGESERIRRGNLTPIEMPSFCETAPTHCHVCHLAEQPTQMVTMEETAQEEDDSE
uniref:G_PROTEIN_RECEP_F2_4 domain-containing protein n=1 Tax=Haemonchus contortus TaxID=6289 RepID=A0A7I5E5F1_HAECO